MTEMYKVEQVAKILDLHPKTILRFIHQGTLKARKIGREWRVQQEDLRTYAHGELANRPKEPVSEKPLSERVSVSAVLEIEEGDSKEVSRISNTVIAVLNAKDPAWGPTRYDLIFHPETRKARFVLFGSPAFLRTILELVEVLVQEPETND